MPDVVGGIAALTFLVLLIFCIGDVITTDEVIVRPLLETIWLLFVAILSDGGSFGEDRDGPASRTEAHRTLKAAASIRDAALREGRGASIRSSSTSTWTVNTEKSRLAIGCVKSS
jgi:hypothetical protein